MTLDDVVAYALRVPLAELQASAPMADPVA